MFKIRRGDVRQFLPFAVAGKRQQFVARFSNVGGSIFRAKRTVNVFVNVANQFLSRRRSFRRNDVQLRQTLANVLAASRNEFHCVGINTASAFLQIDKVLNVQF
ncbi:MAG: hypothetical protein LBP75_08445 [Planctomycetota bacterium]|nr:hypothetical protein [Planctomycetota bacterium]